MSYNYQLEHLLGICPGEVLLDLLVVLAQHRGESSEAQAQTWGSGFIEQGSVLTNTFQMAGLLVYHCGDF